MARRSLSPAHKAAISAGMKRYWASKRGSSSAPSGGSSRGGAATAKTINIDTGKPISREEAALIMFGTAGARKKLAAGKKRRR